MTLTPIADSTRSEGFYCCHSELLMKFQEDGAYKFSAFDKSGTIRSVDRDYYCRLVFGENYRKIENQLSRDIYHYVKADGLNGDQYFSTFHNGLIHGFDKDGTKIYEWDCPLGEENPIYDIAFEAPHFLWMAFPTGQTVAQCSLPEKKEVYRIGDYSYENDHEYLSFPESISIKGTTLFIPNMGNSKLLK